MKHVKKTLATALLLSACSGKKEDTYFVGQWEVFSEMCDDKSEVEPTRKTSGMIYEFTDKGTMSMSGMVGLGTAEQGHEYTALRYSAEDNVLTLKGEEEVKFKYLSGTGDSNTLVQLSLLDSEDNPCPKGVALILGIKRVASGSNGQTQNASGMQGMGTADMAGLSESDYWSASSDEERAEALAKMDPAQRANLEAYLKMENAILQGDVGSASKKGDETPVKTSEKAGEENVDAVWDFIQKYK